MAELFPADLQSAIHDLLTFRVHFATEGQIRRCLFPPPSDSIPSSLGEDGTSSRVEDVRHCVRSLVGSGIVQRHRFKTHLLRPLRSPLWSGTTWLGEGSFELNLSPNDLFGSVTRIYEDVTSWRFSPRQDYNVFSVTEKGAAELKAIASPRDALTWHALQVTELYVALNSRDAVERPVLGSHASVGRWSTALARKDRQLFFLPMSGEHENELWIEGTMEPDLVFYTSGTLKRVAYVDFRPVDVLGDDNIYDPLSSENAILSAIRGIEMLCDKVFVNVEIW